MSSAAKVTAFCNVTFATCPSPVCKKYSVASPLNDLPSARFISKLLSDASSASPLAYVPAGSGLGTVSDVMPCDSVMSLPDIVATVTELAVSLMSCPNTSGTIT